MQTLNTVFSFEFFPFFSKSNSAYFSYLPGQTGSGSDYKCSNSRYLFFKGICCTNVTREICFIGVLFQNCLRKYSTWKKSEHTEEFRIRTLCQQQSHISGWKENNKTVFISTYIYTILYNAMQYAIQYNSRVQYKIMLYTQTPGRGMYGTYTGNGTVRYLFKKKNLKMYLRTKIFWNRWIWQTKYFIGTGTGTCSKLRTTGSTVIVNMLIYYVRCRTYLQVLYSSQESTAATG
jgi:hypothetical protein